jgi:hypothetical protein
VILTEESTLQLIYEEVLKMSRRLESLEGVLEEIIVKDLPEAEMSTEERESHERHLAEMRSGDWVSAEKLK